MSATRGRSARGPALYPAVPNRGEIREAGAGPPRRSVDQASSMFSGTGLLSVCPTGELLTTLS